MTTSSSATGSLAAQKSRRFPLWLRIVGAVLLLGVIVFAVVMFRMRYVPADLNTASTLLSERGLYEITYAVEQSPVPINQIQTWMVRVTTPNGEPVEDAEITVDGGMPQHGHGLPTAPQVTDYLGNGTYRVEGMKFNMSGWWVLNFEVTQRGQTDGATFNLVLD